MSYVKLCATVGSHGALPHSLVDSSYLDYVGKVAKLQSLLLSALGSTVSLLSAGLVRCFINSSYTGAVIPIHEYEVSYSARVNNCGVLRLRGGGQGLLEELWGDTSFDDEVPCQGG